MTATLPGASLERFIATVDRRIGVQLVGKEYLIESRLQGLAHREGFDSVETLLARLGAGDRRLEDLAVEAMTTNETSFFRDQHPFEALVAHVIPELVAANGGSLTIWNGACSSGQESYTLAMSILDHFPRVARPGAARIISTDVSPTMIDRTRTASYTRFEVNRGLPSALAAKHFEQSGREWTAKPALRSMIDAREMNLLEPWVGLPVCDLVLLRNVLIYFTVPVRRDILRRVRTQVLRPGGCLMLGASETVNGIDDELIARRVGSSTFYFRSCTS